MALLALGSKAWSSPSTPAPSQAAEAKQSSGMAGHSHNPQPHVEQEDPEHLFGPLDRSRTQPRPHCRSAFPGGFKLYPKGFSTPQPQYMVSNLHLELGTLTMEKSPSRSRAHQLSASAPRGYSLIKHTDAL